MKKKTEVEIVEDPEKPVKKEILAEAILRMSEAARKLQASGINERALVVLIYDALPNGTYGQGKVAGKPAIKAVLDTMAILKERYCR